ncbi:MAG: NAD(+) synthase, partial [Pseudomonadota bacterium]
LQGTQIVADLDIHRLRHDRAQNISFASSPRPTPYRCQTSTASPVQLTALHRQYTPHPFVPDDEREFDARAREILNIQATGLARRMLAAHTTNLVIGLSGGLDSTLAYLVCLDTLNKLELGVESLHPLTMPGPGTTGQTLGNAQQLTQTCSVHLHEISIEAAVQQHLQDLQHNGEHDVVYENAQARERTQILFNYANKVNGLVVGTGDLSELALGWCTYNADHMASYNVNASVPKTMMAYLVRWYAQHRATTALAGVLQDVLDTPISPELIPPQDGRISQHTEAIVGPYELHDFFLYHFMRFGSGVTKIYTLACLSFADEYTPAEIKRWLGQFFQRFLSQQFKRTTLPPGPKVGSISLSPRGDWRMPDEASAAQILREVEQL